MITIVIVSFKSEKIINQCLKNISKRYKLIVIDNSNSTRIKHLVKRKFRQSKIFLSKNNLGVSKALNIGLKKVNTKFVLFLTPDALIDQLCISRLFKTALRYNNFSIISPINMNKNINKKNLYGYFKTHFNTESKRDSKNLLKVDWVHGGAMFMNLRCIKELGYFDEKIFLDFEDKDICFRSRLINKDVIIDLGAKYYHMPQTSSGNEFSLKVKRQRMWHYGWSSFYFYKKNFNFAYSLKKTFNNFLFTLLKCIYHIFSLNITKSLNHLYYLYGYLASLLGITSFYRSRM
jgi:N-acetylglucosaminyl-diphospho-decaprenol L-rhamnosyltransferase